MKKPCFRIIMLGIIAAVLLCASAFSAFAEEETVYSVNEWNYVDGAIDITGGIPDDAEGVLAGIRERGVLRVATDPYFAPQEFIDPEQEGQARYAGADMELARLIAERMGVRLEIVEMDFQDVLTSVNLDECDLAISALAFMPSRAVTNAMSKGYYFSDTPKTVMLIRQEDADSITALEGLKGKTLIAQQGSLQEAMVAGCEEVPVYLEFRRVPTIGEVYEALRNGRADAGALDAETAEAYLNKNPGCGLVIAEGIEFELQAEYRGDRVAAKKGEYQLLYFVNGVIDEALASGWYEQWIQEARERAGELGL